VEKVKYIGSEDSSVVPRDRRRASLKLSEEGNVCGDRTVSTAQL
jgi:hypothetical protein